MRAINNRLIKPREEGFMEGERDEGKNKRSKVKFE